MRIIKCQKGHFYDGDAYSGCPFCDKNAKKIPPDWPDGTTQKNEIEMTLLLIVPNTTNVDYFTVLTSASSLKKENFNKSDILYNGSLNGIPDSFVLKVCGCEVILKIHVLKCITPLPIAEQKSNSCMVVSSLFDVIQKITLFADDDKRLPPEISCLTGITLYTYLSNKPFDVSKAQRTISLWR